MLRYFQTRRKLIEEYEGKLLLLKNHIADLNDVRKYQQDCLEKVIHQVEEYKQHQVKTPVLFISECEHCNKMTTHISHIAGDTPPSGWFAATGLPAPTPIPVKTCLWCGLISYKDI